MGPISWAAIVVALLASLAAAALPSPPSHLRVDSECALGEACALAAWPSQAPPRNEFNVQVAAGLCSRAVQLRTSELFLYLLKGQATLRALGGDGAQVPLQQQVLAAGDTLVLPPIMPSGQAIATVHLDFDESALCLMVNY